MYLAIKIEAAYLNNMAYLRVHNTVILHTITRMFVVHFSAVNTSPCVYSVSVRAINTKRK